MQPVNASAIMRLVAVICFVLAIFGVPMSEHDMASLGLAFWCASTFV
jgi:hypothetical protein